VAVVCDNVIIHHSKIVQRWLTTHPRVVVLHGALQPSRQSGRAHLGRAQGRLGQQPHLDHRRAPPPGPRLLPNSQPPTSCWRPPHHTAHPGSPKVTDRTTGRPLSTAVWKFVGGGHAAQVCWSWSPSRRRSRSRSSLV
jgi:hypothetical protein